MLRFKVGELALVGYDDAGNGNEGKIVEIIKVGPVQITVMDKVTGLYRYKMADYRVELDGNRSWCVNDPELIKLGDPDQEDKEEQQEELTA